MGEKLTAAEQAARLRMSRERLYRLVRAGYVPALRLRPRGRLLFDPQEVEAALRGAAGRQPVSATT